MRRAIFQIRKPDGDIRCESPDDLRLFISAAVVNHRNGEFSAYRFQGFEDCGRIHGGGDQVNVVRTLFLQFEEDFGKTARRDRFSKAFLADFIVLAETAAECAAGKKYGSASVAAADAGFFSAVRSSPADSRQERAAAASAWASGRSLGPAVSGAVTADVGHCSALPQLSGRIIDMASFPIVRQRQEKWERRMRRKNSDRIAFLCKIEGSAFSFAGILTNLSQFKIFD